MDSKMDSRQLTEEQKEKKVGQLKLQLNGVFRPFNTCGLGIFIPEAKDAVVEL